MSLRVNPFYSYVLTLFIFLCPATDNAWVCHIIPVKFFQIVIKSTGTIGILVHGIVLSYIPLIVVHKAHQPYQCHGTDA